MFADLDDFDNAPVKPTANTETFPCPNCGGSGIYQGIRIYQEKTHCFVCRGRGHFTTSPERREKARDAAARHRAKKLAEKVEASAQWSRNHLDLINFLESASSWSEFAASLFDNIVNYGTLTDKQLLAAEKMKATCERKRRERDEAKAAAIAEKPLVDLTRIKKLFDSALSTGLKKPKLRIDGLELSLAPAHGRNVGAIYVKDHGEYAGKVVPEGKYFGIRNSRADIEAELIALAQDPLKQLTAYGHRTGNCSCCGRKLTRPESVERGIGPVCAGRWGI